MLEVLVLFENVENLRNNNHLVISNALISHGAHVSVGKLSSLGTRNGRTSCLATKVDRPLSEGDNFSVTATCVDAEDFDLVWVMNQPHVLIEKDIYQFLWQLSRKVQFVNSIEALMFLNNKNNLSAIVPSESVVEGYCSNEFEFLWNIVAESDERWIVKPANDGCGADVFLLSRKDTNARAILQSMTGNAVSNYEIYSPQVLGNVKKFCLLQKYVQQAERHEKRVVIAGGEVIGSYGKILNTSDHRSNRIQGSTQFFCELSKAEAALSSQVAKNLAVNGIHFAAIDLAYPYVFEINMVNPGGVQALSRLSGQDYAAIAVQKILAGATRGDHDVAA
ncbi:ATP-grasp domain-containing protein [Brucella intermedia]|uniref:ATP-grasp domain-containing protein n=1 Tax=Brucella intermedia TaxID=94625 RepID=UPI002362E4B8|nr:hypothetical protein [Brucella intermedia]